MLYLREPLDLDNVPEKTEISVELSRVTATELKAIAAYTGLSFSAIVTLGLQKILPEQLAIMKNGHDWTIPFKKDGKEISI